MEERLDFLRRMTKDSEACKHTEITPIEIPGLTIDLVKDKKIDFLVRGLRSYQDYDSEVIMAVSNRMMSGVETIMLFASEKHVHINSTIVRTLAHHNRKMEGFVPKEIEDDVYKKLYSSF